MCSSGMTRFRNVHFIQSGKLENNVHRLWLILIIICHCQRSTEVEKIACTWFGEFLPNVPWLCCLALPGSFLDMFYKPFFRALYTPSTILNDWHNPSAIDIWIYKSISLSLRIQREIGFAEKVDEVEFDKRNAEEKDALGDRLLGMFFTGIGNSMHYVYPKRCQNDCAKRLSVASIHKKT